MLMAGAPVGVLFNVALPPPYQASTSLNVSERHTNIVNIGVRDAETNRVAPITNNEPASVPDRLSQLSRYTPSESLIPLLRRPNGSVHVRYSWLRLWLPSCWAS